MNKTKIIVTACVVSFFLTIMSVTFGTAKDNTSVAAAIEPTASTSTMACNGDERLCYSLMRDSDGNIVSEDIFNQNLDKAIAEGTISKSDRSYFVERYESCSVNSANCGSGRGCGNGRGMKQGGCGRVMQ